MKVYVPPIKCQGIKTKLAPWITGHILTPDSGRWIEPFMGSGVVGFNVRPKKALFADINPHIINFYNAIKKGEVTSAKAKAFLETEGLLLSRKGAEHYYTVRERFNQTGNPLDFLFLSRSRFNGVIRFNKKGHYNVPFGHKPERFVQAYVTKISNQINYVETAIRHYDWTFVCADFRAVTAEATHRDFIYFDPPYIGRHTDYYNSWSDEDEQDLFDYLISTSAKFILSTWHSNQYRHNPWLNKHSGHFVVYTKDHFYHVGAREDNRNPMVEAIVLNFSSDKLPATADVVFEKTTQLRLLEAPAEYEINGTHA